MTIEVSLQNALVEAARRLDERRREIAQARPTKTAPQRLLSSFAESSGVLAAILMARKRVTDRVGEPRRSGEDGRTRRRAEALIETVDELGGAQGCQPFGGFFIEYDRFQLLCLPVAAPFSWSWRPGRLNSESSGTRPSTWPTPWPMCSRNRRNRDQMQHATTSPRLSDPSVPTADNIVEARCQS